MEQENQTEELEKGYDPSKKRTEATLGDWVEVTHARPPRIYRQQVEKFLGTSFRDLKVMKQGNPSYRANLIRFAIQKSFTADEIEKEANYETYGNEDPIPVERVMVNTGTEQFEGLSTGYLFLNLKDDAKAVLSVYPNFNGGIVLEVFSKDKETSGSVLKRLNDYIRENNFLKGKRLLSNGEFLNVAPTKWDDVVLSDEMKHVLQTYVLGYMEKIDELKKLGLPTKRGLLIIGPPGNGKTMIGKALAYNSTSTFIWVPSSSDYRHVYLMARELAPSIVFIEDIAAHGGLDRRAGPVDSDTAELLNMLDGVEANDLVLTVATENNFDLLDPALRNRPGRFDLIVPLPNPPVELREQILKHYLPEAKNSIITYAANQTSGYSGAHLRELATRLVLENAKTPEDVQEVINGISMTFSVTPEEDTEKDVNEASVAELYQHRQMDKKKKKPVNMMSHSFEGEEELKEDLCLSIDLTSSELEEIHQDLELGITLVHDNLKRVITTPPINITAKTVFGKYNNDRRVDVELYEDDTRAAQFTYFVSDPKKLSKQQLGLMESLTAARFASEMAIPVNATLTNPSPNDLDLMLSRYAGVNVQFLGDTWKTDELETPTSKTILLSGGLDSAALLFAQQGEADALTFYHGQPAFTHGQWTEKQAVKELIRIANEVFEKEINLSFANHRFRVFKKGKVWAKSFRNLFFAAHGSLLFPDSEFMLGCHADDIEHDCNDTLIKDFRKLTGSFVSMPNFKKSRAEIIEQLAENSESYHPYIYASTQSCQMTRFYGKKHLFCGSCHSCLLRAPAVSYGLDPRFSNFKTDSEVTPIGLALPVQQVWRQKKFSWGAFSKWWGNLNEEQKEHFAPHIEYIKKLEA